MRTLKIGILALGIWCAVVAGAEPASAPARREEDKPKVSVIGLVVLREVDEPAMSALLDSHGVGESRSGVMLVGRVAMPGGGCGVGEQDGADREVCR
jgi:hypothetical protein